MFIWFGNNGLECKELKNVTACGIYSISFFADMPDFKNCKRDDIENCNIRFTNDSIGNEKLKLSDKKIIGMRIKYKNDLTCEISLKFETGVVDNED